MADHAGDGESPARGARAVIVAVVPIGVGHNGLAADFVEGDLLRAVTGRGRDGNGCGNGFRVSDGPFQGLHSSHGTAGDGEQFLDSQRIDQHLLQADNIGDRDGRKAHAPGTPGLGIDGAWTGGAPAAAQDVGADDEILIGIEGLAGSDHTGPPAAFARGVRVAGKSVQCENRVGAGGVQRPVGFIGDFDVLKRDSHFKVQLFEPGCRGLGDHLLGRHG